MLWFCPTLRVPQANTQSEIEALLRQIAGLQEQLTNATSGGAAAEAAAPRACPVFSRTLSRGATGDDVRELQKILASGGYLKAEPTGYFGALTEKALQGFQAKAKLVSSGTPQTTGWGVFGPKTRAFLAAVCTKQLMTLSTPTETSCPTAPTQPARICRGYWQRTNDARQCHVGWQCVEPVIPSTGNAPPTITSIDGPTTIGARQTGVWSVIANDPEGGVLSYSATWGDEEAASLLEIPAGNVTSPSTPTPRFSHYFTRIGQFAPTFSVRDGVGNVTSATISVTVLASSTPILAGGGATAATRAAAGESSCFYAGGYYPEGTETQGYSTADLCLTTGGVCQGGSSYTPRFKCAAGEWTSALVNPYPNLPNYANVVGSQCAPMGSTARGATKQVVVVPGTLLCRGLLCATAQTYTPITLTCEYVSWVDWGLFANAATTTSVCSPAAPCEYVFGGSGRACAPKQNGACPVPTVGNDPQRP